MLRLIHPCKAYMASYIEAFDEYESYPRRAGNPLTNPHTTDLLAKYERYHHERNLPVNRVGATYFWLVNEEDHRFLGEITVRHRLNDVLLHYGGHIGYAVRLGEWNKGYGTLMLSLALPHARALGIDRCLITCDDDNIGSARVMEKNGFVLADKLDQVVDGCAITTRRYWKTL